VPIAFRIARPLLDAQEVVGRELRRKPLEDLLAGADDVEQRATREHRQPFEPAQLQTAIRRLRRRRLGDSDVVAVEVHGHHVDRRPGAPGKRDDRFDLGVLLDRQPFGNEHQRFVPLDVDEPLEQVAQRHPRLLGVLPHAVHQLGRLVEHVALALAALLVRQAAALARDDLRQNDLIALVDD
jgi:hypothetical protein